MEVPFEAARLQVPQPAGGRAPRFEREPGRRFLAGRDAPHTGDLPQPLNQLYRHSIPNRGDMPACAGRRDPDAHRWGTWAGANTARPAGAWSGFLWRQPPQVALRAEGRGLPLRAPGSSGPPAAADSLL